MGMLSPKFARRNSGPVGSKAGGKKTAFPMFGGFLGNATKARDVELVDTMRERAFSDI